MCASGLTAGAAGLGVVPGQGDELALAAARAAASTPHGRLSAVGRA
ncbi:hypothetical protein [Rhodococcus globerulus]|uniref:Uncharacterized protein n=1 Tax=Rhodococcus globerulus TaxID=33008 RepID=A0ABU4C2K2_RHOGO|nr:hypothetical protein [Rhodococcus globerulus]MDV6270618.1 hypothetical protein [Rhodococcus globerulus]